MRYAMRCVMTRVLPEPAPASNNTGPSTATMPSRCCGFMFARRSSTRVTPASILTEYEFLRVVTAFQPLVTHPDLFRAKRNYPRLLRVVTHAASPRKEPVGQTSRNVVLKEECRYVSFKIDRSRLVRRVPVCFAGCCSHSGDGVACENRSLPPRHVRQAHG